jgi:hypothetical protein
VTGILNTVMNHAVSQKTLISGQLEILSGSEEELCSMDIVREGNTSVCIINFSSLM